MKLSKSIFIAIVALLLNACSSKIEGEAFVVTKGGESKKLGLVEVQAYKMSDIDGFKKKLLSEYSEYIDKITENYKFVGLKEKHDERNKLIVEINEAAKKYKCPDVFVSSMLLKSICYQHFPKDLVVDFKQRATNIKNETSAIVSNKAIKQLLDKDFDRIYMAGIVAEHTKNLEAIKTKTDADGRFAMTLPSGEFLIIATGSRQSLGEDYYWLLHTNKSGAIRLANDTMYDQGCDTCLFAKTDIGKLNDKKKLLDPFINGGGNMMIGAAEDTGIYSSFWQYMCGGPYPYNQHPRVFEWAECVN